MGDASEALREQSGPRLANMCGLFFTSVAQAKKQIEQLENFFSNSLYPAFIKESEAAVAQMRLAQQEMHKKWLQERNSLIHERKIAEQRWLHEKQAILQARSNTEKLWLQEKQALARERDRASQEKQALIKELQLLKLQYASLLQQKNRQQEDQGKSPEESVQSSQPMNPFSAADRWPQFNPTAFGGGPWFSGADSSLYGFAGTKSNGFGLDSSAGPAGIWQGQSIGDPVFPQDPGNLPLWNPAFASPGTVWNNPLAAADQERRQYHTEGDGDGDGESASSPVGSESGGDLKPEIEEPAMWWKKSETDKDWGLMKPPSKSRVPPARVLQHRLRFKPFGRI